MENFNFTYNDSVKKIKCFYTYNGEVSLNNYWEGYIMTKNIDGILDVEGFENDSMDSLETSGQKHYRYILGNKAISFAQKSLKFVVYPSKIAPILYDLYYDESDCCFYGTWKFINSYKHNYPFNESGKAIIRIDDEKKDEKQVNNILKMISYKAKKEYDTEIENFTFWLENHMLDNEDNKLHKIKSLSMLSDVIKK